VRVALHMGGLEWGGVDGPLRACSHSARGAYACTSRFQQAGVDSIIVRVRVRAGPRAPLYLCRERAVERVQARVARQRRALVRRSKREHERHGPRAERGVGRCGRRGRARDQAAHRVADQDDAGRRCSRASAAAIAALLRRVVPAPVVSLVSGRGTVVSHPGASRPESSSRPAGGRFFRKSVKIIDLHTFRGEILAISPRSSPRFAQSHGAAGSCGMAAWLMTPLTCS
jgi:hypothetical protein